MKGLTYCLGYSDECNGCSNEKRWSKLLGMEIQERAVLQKTMHCIDEGLCASNNMSEKERK